MENEDCFIRVNGKEREFVERRERVVNFWRDSGLKGGNVKGGFWWDGGVGS